MDRRGAWWATVLGVKKSRTQLSTHKHIIQQQFAHRSAVELYLLIETAVLFQKLEHGFPCGAEVKNPPANTGDPS